MSEFLAKPGSLYVMATLLPLAACTILLIAGFIRGITGRYQPSRIGAYFCTFCMLISAVLALFGLSQVLGRSTEELSRDYTGRMDWLRFPMFPRAAMENHGAALQLGYRIDLLSAILFAMVTFIASLIFIFSLGYMREETNSEVNDHEAHIHRHGRFGRFFLYLSLFCFSMLNLLIADNLFQVFLSWELVGVCSFLLIGFYHERKKAGLAANKAFIMNRIGDAGFLIGLAIVWFYFGTFNFQEIFAKIRTPEVDRVGRTAPPELVNQFLRGDRNGDDANQMKLNVHGKYLLIFPSQWRVADFEDRQVCSEETPPEDNDMNFMALPYWLFLVMGAGLFLGCVGKSAQFPLHTWLPDAMEGPTPVSALIHAATMVAAGVYLVGRCFPLFAEEVLILIAYTGAFTAFLAATIAVAQNDIKRVLAYSTVSQLGFMMLALGVGGWVAGLMHLVTHAFFKALLFLGSGSVIYGCHHEQDLRKMGGLRHKMPITAVTMLLGVLAIIGTPFFSGWYSKERILTTAYGFGLHEGKHILLFVLPVFTAGLTAFYMFRMWFLTFTGKPRDQHIYEKVHESPTIMVLPLAILAFCSLGIAWGWPLWDVEASQLGEALAKAEPTFISSQFAGSIETAHHGHLVVTALALGLAALGSLAAYLLFVVKLEFALAKEANPNWLHNFFLNRWYFDELYDRIFVKPTIVVADDFARMDKTSPGKNPDKIDCTIQLNSLDGWINAIGLTLFKLGLSLRRVQSGSIRRYVLTLVITGGCIFALLSLLMASH